MNAMKNPAFFQNNKGETVQQLKYIILYKKSLLEKCDVLEKIMVDATFSSVHKTSGIYQFLNIMDVKENHVSVIIYLVLPILS